MNYRQNDYELIYMVREKDDGSQDILFNKYLPIIKRLAYAFYQKYDGYGYDYEDFQQEAMIAFQRAIISYDENKDTLFYTYCVLCMRRSLMTFCRNISNINKNISNKKCVSVDEYENVFLDSRADIDSICDFREIEIIAKKIISDLDFDNSCIFELRYNGFSYKEIGVILDMPVSSVEFKNRFAKRKFDRLLKKYYLEKSV